MKKIIITPPTEQSNKRLRVCAYARVSTESLKQGDSLENQITAYERLIENNPAYEFAGVYADKGITGFKEERPEFQRMLADARQHAFDRILTKSISRFARNAVVFLKTVRELKALGITVYFEEQHMDTISEDGGLMLTVLAAFAQAEAESMGQNMRWAYQKKFARGEVHCNAGRLLGYDTDEYGCLVINPAQAEIVRTIYTLYIGGLGIFKIAAKLNAERVPTVTGAKWHPNTVRGILINEKYKGDVKLQKYCIHIHKKIRNDGVVPSYYVAEDHPAIIAPEDWETVQTLMASRRKGKSDGHANRYKLSGKLICPHCGKVLYRHRGYHNTVEWCCSTYITKGKSACPGITVPDTAVRNQQITEPTVVEEVMIDGKKYYRYTGKEAFDKGTRACRQKTENTDGRILPRVHRPRRTAIKL